MSDKVRIQVVKDSVDIYLHSRLLREVSVHSIPDDRTNRDGGFEFFNSADCDCVVSFSPWRATNRSI